MEILLTILYVAVCLFLILVVLMQSGKAGDLASTFGGVSSQTAFGSRGTANVLSKATTACAVLFLFCAFALAVVSASRTGSALEEVGKEDALPRPAAEKTVPETGTPSAPAPEEAPAEAPPAESAPESPSGSPSESQ